METQNTNMELTLEEKLDELVDEFELEEVDAFSVVAKY